MENIFDGIQNEGEQESPIAETLKEMKSSEKEGKETPASAEEEKKPVEEETPAEEDKETEEQTPFHKHPRWQKVYRRSKELEKSNAELTERLAILEGKMGEVSVKSEDEPIPQWFISAYGEDNELWAKFQAHERQKEEKIRNEMYELFEQKEIQNKQAEEHWNNYLEENLEQLREEGFKFDRNKFLMCLRDNENKVFDKDGSIDFKAGMEIYLWQEEKSKRICPPARNLLPT